MIQLPPRLCVSRVQVENLVPHLSDRLAAKSVYHDPNLEKQAKRVMLSKWQPSASAPRSAPATPDATIATRFHETFQEPLSSSKREAMRELFPRAGARGRRRRRLEHGFIQHRNPVDRIFSFLVSYNSVCSTALRCLVFVFNPIAYGTSP